MSPNQISSSTLHNSLMRVQFARIAPSKIMGAGFGVFANVVFRKGDYIAAYAVQTVLGIAEYNRDYKGKKCIECA